MPASVDILLASYQGQEYISQQIESILQQTVQGFNLIIRDDGSKDKTVQLIRSFAAQFPDQIIHVESDPRARDRASSGASQNFSRLMEQSKGDYIFFSDQDDVWVKDKVEKMLERMEILEKQYGKETPLLLHSDLRVVDRYLQPISPSFWRYVSLDPSKDGPNRLLQQNVVTGCATLINRALLSLATPIPKEAMMHDFWLALTASFFGQIAFYNQSLVLYRQHGNNSIGASRLFSLKRLYALSRRREVSQRIHAQAVAFLERYREKLSLDKLRILEAFVGLRELSFFQRKRALIANQFYKQGLLRNVEQFLIG